jgi:hypothetical protein
VEEVGEGIAVPEHLVHFFFGHRAEAARPAARVHVPCPALRPVGRPAGGAGLLVRPPVGAQLVVFLPFFGIAEDFVGLVDLLELGFGGFIAGVDVGMVFAGELAVRLLQLLRGGRLRNTERRIVVLEVHIERFWIRVPGSRSGSEPRTLNLEP